MAIMGSNSLLMLCITTLLTIYYLEDEYTQSSRKSSHISLHLDQKAEYSHNFIVVCFSAQGILSHSTQAIQ